MSLPIPVPYPQVVGLLYNQHHGLWVPPSVDDSGYLLVNVAAGGGSGGTAATDESPFTAGVTPGTPLMVWDPTSGQLVVAQSSPGTREIAVTGSFSATPPTSNAASSPAQTTVGTVAGQIIGANASRKALSVQNTGTTVIKLVLGAGAPTQTVYHLSLPRGGTADDGSSSRWDGTISGVLWLGAVQAISSVSGGTCVITELT